VSAGLFCALAELVAQTDLPRYEREALSEVESWFDANLKTPFDTLQFGCYRQAVCWFKPGAHEHLRRAWELVAILERNNVLI
jgi:hypothetical protein